MSVAERTWSYPHGMEEFPCRAITLRDITYIALDEWGRGIVCSIDVSGPRAKIDGGTNVATAELDPNIRTATAREKRQSSEPSGHGHN